MTSSGCCRFLARRAAFFFSCLSFNNASNESEDSCDAIRSDTCACRQCKHLGAEVLLVVISANRVVKLFQLEIFDKMMIGCRSYLGYVTRLADLMLVRKGVRPISGCELCNGLHICICSWTVSPSCGSAVQQRAPGTQGQSHTHVTPEHVSRSYLEVLQDASKHGRGLLSLALAHVLASEDVPHELRRPLRAPMLREGREHRQGSTSSMRCRRIDAEIDAGESRPTLSCNRTP